MSKKNKLIIPVILFLTFVTTGCSTRELTKFSDDNTCGSTIEGNYYKETVVKSDYPALFVKMPKNPKLLEGKIISVEQEGIIFDPDNVGFYDQGETFFSYDTLYGAVDSTGKIFHGNVPDFYSTNQKLSIELQKLGNDEKKKIVLHPNEPFSYCIEPGSYKVSNIEFIFNQKSIQDIGYDFPELTIHISPGKVNYIGNIFADYKNKNDKNILVIPCKRNDNDAAAAVGFMGGLIGSIAYAVANDIANSDLHHVLHFELDKNFLPEANMETEEITIEIK